MNPLLYSTNAVIICAAPVPSRLRTITRTELFYLCTSRSSSLLESLNSGS